MGQRVRRIGVLVSAWVCLWIVGTALAEQAYKTKNVIIAVMDGVRYSETFGDPKRALIPNMAKLEKEGTLYTNCLDTGVTITRQGHSTIATGTWQTVPLAGPMQTMPTLSEYARNELGWTQKDCWVIFGKGTYSYASYSSFPGYGKKCEPSFIIALGENEIADDDKVLAQALKAIETDKPRLMFLNFGVTDHVAHKVDWELYRKAILHCDEMFGKLWEKVQSTPGYKDQTTMIFTNDHGRHSDKKDLPHDGFESHGDKCPGCQHIMVLVVGPDVKRGAVIDRQVLQVDMAPTAAELLGFQTPLAEGNVLTDCLAEPLSLNKKLAKTPEAQRGLELKKLAERDLLKAVADATLERDVATLSPSPETEILMRGMIRAAVAAKDDRYRAFAEKWAQAHMNEGTENPHVARVLLELAAKTGKPENYITLAKTCAEKCASEAPPAAPGAPEAACKMGLMARVGQFAKDQKLADAAKNAFGLQGKTEQDLVKAWQKLGLKPAPMACDFGPKSKPTGTSTMVDTAWFMALADAAAAMPDDRLVRLACDLQQSACSRGLQEIGAVWDDPVMSALNLYQVRALGKLRRAKPIQWVEVKLEKGKGPRKITGPLWAFPDQFYKGCFPYSFDLLKYKVDEKGHYADGSVMADGAALLLFAETSGVKMPAELGPQWVRWGSETLPEISKGCTRVIFEFGGGKATTWKGSVAVENGTLAAFLPYLFEDEDLIDPAQHTFDCTTAGATDGLALDVQGGPEAKVVMTATPQNMTFTLGELKEKKTIEATLPGKNFIRATISAQ